MAQREARAKKNSAISSVSSSHEARASQSTKPRPAQQSTLRQIVLSAFIDQVARRVTQAPSSSATSTGGGGATQFPYSATTTEEHVFVHPTSFVSRTCPDYDAFHEIVRSTKHAYMHGVTRVSPGWLFDLGAALAEVGRPVASPPPHYDAATGTVRALTRVAFGPHHWPLPLQDLEHPPGRERTRLFAQFVLDGSVLPALGRFVPHLAATPLALSLAKTRAAQTFVATLARAFSAEQLTFVFSQWVSLHPILRRFGPYWIQQSALALLALFCSRCAHLDSLSLSVTQEHSPGTAADAAPATPHQTTMPFPVACLHVVCQEYQHNQVSAQMFACPAVHQTQTPTATPSSSFDGELADTDAYKHILGDDSTIPASMHSFLNDEEDYDDASENGDETDDQDKPFIATRPLYTLDFNAYVTARLRELMASDMAPYLKQVYFQLCPDDKKVIEGILLQTRS